MNPGRAFALAAALAIAPLVACGEDDDDNDRDRFAAVPKRTVQAPPGQTAPRWQRIAAFAGQGASSKGVNVSAGALQWRARWRCRSGSFRLAVTPRPQAGGAGANGRCPGRGKAVWASAGRHRLRIVASGPWRLVVEEEVRTPLHEPPLRGMDASSLLARGKFYPVEIKGAGTAALYRLPRGRLALRMERFATEPNPSLVVWLSEARRPNTTREAFSAPHTELRALRSTLGDQNYLLPRGLEPGRIRSVVVWNKPSRIAYAAATLMRVR